MPGRGQPRYRWRRLPEVEEELREGQIQPGAVEELCEETEIHLPGGAAWLEPEVKAPERPAWSEVGEMEGLTPAGSPSALPLLLCHSCHWRLGAPMVQGTPSSGRGSRFTRMFPSLLLGNGGM